ncbi:helix-hairpin-helix domain-containing protein [uncultured Mailhella sp.]|uniref:ComEA family DNA-binding protein n=1 Tax=uncultured Mailhella sp. TaxID=1981031 RepID=UPI0025FB918B|nr:helix-hairpin-helix domain-containing protein [uncultured Mailhella sp.]
MKKLISTLSLCALLACAAPAMADEDLVPGEGAINLNTATVEELMSIPDANITREMAEAMVKMAREKPFVMAEDLLKVPGLDNKTLEAINPVEEQNSLWYDPDNAEMTLAPSKC